MFRLRSIRLVFLLTLLGLQPLALLAQEDIAGEWTRFPGYSNEDDNGSQIGDYTGIPINSADRYRADTWESIVGLPENECKQSSADHSWTGPLVMRITKEVDNLTQTLIAYHLYIEYMGAEQTIYMDGRPHPPEYARHTFGGFSTGKWEGDILAVETDHLKQDLLRWNGITRSDRAKLGTHFMRHGNYLTVAVAIYDPVYLTEPDMRTFVLVYSPQQTIVPYPCEPFNEIGAVHGVIPSHMPGTNDFLNEYPARYGIPPEAARGGAETMYPEFVAKMKTMKKLPRLTSKADRQN